jgi:hypothetical protein
MEIPFLKQVTLLGVICDKRIKREWLTELIAASAIITFVVFAIKVSVYALV